MLEAQEAALRRFVNRLASRSILTDDEETAILSLTGQAKQVDNHIDLVPVGGRVEHSCLLVEGLIGRFGQNRNGSRQITSLYIPGDMADLPSVVSPQTAWGLSALADSTILRVPHNDLRRIAAKHPGVTEAFWRDCVADGSIFSEWVVNVGNRDAMCRIAHLFCEMAIRYERAGLGDRRSFLLPITQVDLGDATGLTSVHVNRILKGLRALSIVTARSGKVTVHDWDRLVTVGEFDDGYMLFDGPARRIAAVEWSARSQT